MRHARALLAALALLVPVNAAAAARIVAVQATRGDSTLDCTVITEGLPDPASRETLASGLPSAITLSFALVDARGREREGSRAEVRVEPDPWEGSLVVRAANQRQRLANLGELDAWMRRLGPFPVAPLRGMDVSRPLRFRVRLAVHPLAPAEVERAHALFSGGMGGGGAERREVSTGMGSLLRFFLGRSPAGEWQAQALSAPFDARALESSP